MNTQNQIVETSMGLMIQVKRLQTSAFLGPELAQRPGLAQPQAIQNFAQKNSWKTVLN